jgi:hypothetical protein
MTKRYFCPYANKVLQRIQRYKVYHNISYETLPLYQTCNCDEHIDSKKLTNKDFSEIFELVKQQYILLLCAAKLYPVPK